jgi:hypothetical protein
MRCHAQPLSAVVRDLRNSGATKTQFPQERNAGTCVFAAATPNRSMLSAKAVLKPEDQQQQHTNQNYNRVNDYHYLQVRFWIAFGPNRPKR